MERERRRRQRIDWERDGWPNCLHTNSYWNKVMSWGSSSIKGSRETTEDACFPRQEHLFEFVSRAEAWKQIREQKSVMRLVISETELSNEEEAEEHHSHSIPLTLHDRVRPGHYKELVDHKVATIELKSEVVPAPVKPESKKEGDAAAAAAAAGGDAVGGGATGSSKSDGAAHTSASSGAIEEKNSSKSDLLGNEKESPKTEERRAPTGDANGKEVKQEGTKNKRCGGQDITEPANAAGKKEVPTSPPYDYPEDNDDCVTVADENYERPKRGKSAPIWPRGVPLLENAKLPVSSFGSNWLDDNYLEEYFEHTRNKIVYAREAKTKGKSLDYQDTFHPYMKTVLPPFLMGWNMFQREKIDEEYLKRPDHPILEVRDEETGEVKETLGAALYGIFDGHSGPYCARYAAYQLPRILTKGLVEARDARKAGRKAKNTAQVFHDAVVELERQWMLNYGEGTRLDVNDPYESELLPLYDPERNIWGRDRSTIEDGTTCCTVMLVDDLAWRPKGANPDHLTLYVANVGDSRTVLARYAWGRCWKYCVPSNFTDYQLNTEHKPNHWVEEWRILCAGGSVGRTQEEAWTFNPVMMMYLKLSICFSKYRRAAWRAEPGGLAMSRTIGDIDCKRKKGVVDFHPDVYMREIDPTMDRFLIIACDGVWDVASNAQAVTIVSEALYEQFQLDRMKDMTNACHFAAQTLVKFCYMLRSSDNISATVVLFRDIEKSGNQWKPEGRPNYMANKTPRTLRRRVEEARLYHSEQRWEAQQAKEQVRHRVAVGSASIKPSGSSRE